MKPRLMTLLTLTIPLGIGELCALPSGTKIVPKEVKIPQLPSGRTLPVTLLPSERSDREIYVLPNEGIFQERKKALVPATTDCNRVANAMKLVRGFDDNRELLLKLLERDRARIIQEEDAIFALTKTLTKNQKDLAIQQEILKEKKAAFDLASDRHVAALTEQQSAQRAVEAARLSGDEAELKGAEEKLKEAKKNRSIMMVELGRRENEFSDARNAVNAAKRVIADLEGEIEGRDEAANKIRSNRTRNQADFDALEVKNETILQEFSSSQGALVRMVIDFAPSAYLETLKTANPDYTFTYVPVTGASVKLTFPEFKPDSPLNKLKGNMVVAQEWDTADRAFGQNSFFQALSGLNPEQEGTQTTSEAPLEDLKELAMAFSDSLSGTRSLTVILSPLGYCALENPKLIAGEIETGAIETFAMSLFLAYPVQYQAKVTGRYNSQRILHEVYKKSKSSSWFGLRKKEREEFTRRLTDNEMMDIKVDVNSPLFGPDEARVLREKMGEQIAFLVAKEHLQFEKAPQSNFENINSPSGASLVSKRLMTIRSPWTFWTGMVLGSLDAMFGGRSQTSINDQILHKWINVNWNEEYALSHSHVLTVGDLKDTEIQRQ